MSIRFRTNKNVKNSTGAKAEDETFTQLVSQYPALPMHCCEPSWPQKRNHKWKYRERYRKYRYGHSSKYKCIIPNKMKHKRTKITLALPGCAVAGPFSKLPPKSTGQWNRSWFVISIERWRVRETLAPRLRWQSPESSPRVRTSGFTRCSLSSNIMCSVSGSVDTMITLKCGVRSAANAIDSTSQRCYWRTTKNYYTCTWVPTVKNRIPSYFLYFSVVYLDIFYARGVRRSASAVFNIRPCCSTRVCHRDLCCGRTTGARLTPLVITLCFRQ